MSRGAPRRRRARQGVYVETYGAAKSINFNGSSQWLSTTEAPLALAHAFSVSCWVKTTFGARCLASCDDGTTDNRVQWSVNGAGKSALTIVADTSIVVAIASTTTIATGSWVHLAATFDAGATRTAKLYVAGTQEGGDDTFTDDLTALGLDGFLVAACTHGAEQLFWGGNVANLAIYAGAQDGRVSSWAANPAFDHGRFDDCLHWWPMGDYSLDSTAVGGTLYDRAGTANLTPNAMVAGDIQTDHPS